MRTEPDSTECPPNIRMGWYGAKVAPIGPDILNLVESPSALDTFGPFAERLESIWWLMFGLAVPIRVRRRQHSGE